jgi:hypothetical protein
MDKPSRSGITKATGSALGPDLEQFRPIRGHLMESNQSTQQGEQRRAILVSGKLFNDDDGLI